MTRRALATVVLTSGALAGCGSQHGAARPAVFEVTAPGATPAPEVATGFALGPGRVATVAHVLGDHGTGATVTLSGGRRATVLAIDQRDDLALLGVPALRAAPARLGDKRTAVAVLVVRDGRPRVLAATVRRTILARIRTPDGSRIVRRRALELRADVAPGDSGAPVLTAAGRVVGVVFAQSDQRPHVAYAVDVSALAALAPRRAGRS